jgi:hypothetical protein
VPMQPTNVVWGPSLIVAALRNQHQAKGMGVARCVGPFWLRFRCVIVSLRVAALMLTWIQSSRGGPSATGASKPRIGQRPEGDL